jgi:Cdc6-like AAA superfamily ATPase
LIAEHNIDQTHYNKLTQRAQQAIELSSDERISNTQKKVWITHPRAQMILEEFEYLFHHEREERMPNLVVVGDTNNGKTTILNKFMEMHPSYVDVPSNIYPIIKIQAPISPSEKALYEKILDALKVPYGISASAARKEAQVIEILTDIQTKILIVDELQDIFHGTKPQKNKFLTALKHLGNTLQISIIAAGVPSVQRVLASDPQLANRFTTMKIPRWKYDKDFLRLLISLERTLPLKEASSLHHNEIASRIYDLSEGLIGEVSSLLKKATIFAIKSNREKIDISVLNSIHFVKPSHRRR